MSRALTIAANIRKAMARMEENRTPASKASFGKEALDGILSELERLGRAEAAARVRWFDVTYRFRDEAKVRRRVVTADFDLADGSAEEVVAGVVAGDHGRKSDEVVSVHVRERDPFCEVSVRGRATP